MSDSRLQRWALLAEVAGAVAVVVTLGFVAMEMRSNTNAIQAQTYQDLMKQLNDYRALALLDPVSQDLEERLGQHGWESLSPSEQRRIRAPAMIRWGIYEAAYYANERGVLGAREWERFQVGVCRSVEALDAFWDPGGGITPMAELLTPDFVEYIESSCG